MPGGRHRSPSSATASAIASRSASSSTSRGRQFSGAAVDEHCLFRQEQRSLERATDTRLTGWLTSKLEGRKVTGRSGDVVPISPSRVPSRLLTRFLSFG